MLFNSVTGIQLSQKVNNTALCCLVFGVSRFKRYVNDAMQSDIR